MRAAILGLALMCAAFGPAVAEPEAAECPTEVNVKDAAGRGEVTEVVLLRSRSGYQFMMLVFASGQGLVLAKTTRAASTA